MVSQKAVCITICYWTYELKILIKKIAVVLRLLKYILSINSPIVNMVESIRLKR
jgi:hypothetical protein